MPFDYKKVLVIGATSGIGKELANKLVQNGTQLIISGRRKDNLDAFVQQHGAEKVTSKVFDIMQLDQVSRIDPTSIVLNTNNQRSPNLLLRSSPSTQI